MDDQQQINQASVIINNLTDDDGLIEVLYELIRDRTSKNSRILEMLNHKLENDEHYQEVCRIERNK